MDKAVSDVGHHGGLVDFPSCFQFRCSWCRELDSGREIPKTVVSNQTILAGEGRNPANPYHYRVCFRGISEGISDHCARLCSLVSVQ